MEAASEWAKVQTASLEEPSASRTCHQAKSELQLEGNKLRSGNQWHLENTHIIHKKKKKKSQFLQQREGCLIIKQMLIYNNSVCSLATI